MLKIFCIYDKQQYDIRTYFVSITVPQIGVLKNLQPYGIVVLPLTDKT